MIKILFSELPESILWPLFIGMLIGIVCLGGYPKTHKYQKVTIFCIIFMIFWRTVMLIVSGRYAASIFIPACILTAFAMWRGVPYWLKNNKLKWLNSNRRLFIIQIFPWVSCMLIAIFLLGKSMRFNPYRNVIKKTSYVLKDSISRLGQDDYLVLSTQREAKRLSYYSDNPSILIIQDEKDSYKYDLEVLEEIFWRYRFSGYTLYGCVFENNISDLKAKDNTYSIESLYNKETNLRRNKRINLYRSIGNSKISAASEPLSSDILLDKDNNIISNGTMEKLLNKNYTNSILTSIPNSDDLWLLPTNWSFAVKKSTVANIDNIVYRLNSEDSLSGNYSLEIMADINSYISTQKLYPVGDYRFSFLIKGNCKQEILISLILYDIDKNIHIKKYASFILPDDEVYSICIPLEKEHMDERNKFNIAISFSEGKVLIDDIFLLQL